MWSAEKDIGHKTESITINDSITTTLTRLWDILPISRIAVIQVGGLPGWLRPYDYVIQFESNSGTKLGKKYYFYDESGVSYDIMLFEGGIHEISYNSKNPKLKYFS